MSATMDDPVRTVKRELKNALQETAAQEEAKKRNEEDKRRHFAEIKQGQIKTYQDLLNTIGGLLTGLYRGRETKEVLKKLLGSSGRVCLYQKPNFIQGKFIGSDDDGSQMYESIFVSNSLLFAAYNPKTRSVEVTTRRGGRTWQDSVEEELPSLALIAEISPFADPKILGHAIARLSTDRLAMPLGYTYLKNLTKKYSATSE